MNPAVPADAAPRSLGATGPALHAWLMAGAPYPAVASAALRRYGWSRRLFRFNLSLQRRLVGSPPLQQPPLFALGLWRAGTTLLHELLAAHPALCTTRTWQCMAPSSFGVMGRPRSTAAVLRPMDSFEITTDSPQEDELALLLLGAPSVYRAWLDPRRLPDLTALLDADAWRSPWSGEDDWLDFLATVNQIEGPARRLLLKSPTHSFRTRSLLLRFPEAACVWVTRDPLDTWVSNLKMWRAMASTYGLAPMPEGALEAFLTVAFQRAAQALQELTRTVPRERLVVLDLATLQQQPLSVTLATFKRLGMTADTSVSAPLGATVQRHADLHGPLKRYEMPVQHPPEPACLHALATAQALAMRSHGL
jgi:hypothetical protein